MNCHIILTELGRVMSGSSATAHTPTLSISEDSMHGRSEHAPTLSKLEDSICDLSEHAHAVSLWEHVCPTLRLTGESRSKGGRKEHLIETIWTHGININIHLASSCNNLLSRRPFLIPSLICLAPQHFSTLILF